jgi:hypothetical protein
VLGPAHRMRRIDREDLADSPPKGACAASS